MEEKQMFLTPENIAINEQFGVCKMLKTRTIGKKTQVFDLVRHKFVALTREELVRQSFVHYLVNSKHYPAALMANEVEIKINDKRLRCDTVLYNKDLTPLMIVEYKAPSVEINQKTMNQITNYTFVLKAKYLILTNGNVTFCSKFNENTMQYEPLSSVPNYDEL